MGICRACGRVGLAFLTTMAQAAFATGAAGPTTAPAAAANEYKKAPGPYQVVETTCDWRDAKRGRNVPARIYAPKDGDGPFPVVIFSHGLGGSREAGKYLGRHWASHGYVSVHIQHVGSDASVWRPYVGKPAEAMEAMQRATKDLREILHRPRDVSFAIDQMQRLSTEKGSPFAGRLDMAKVAVAGHSFGAWTALVSAGQRLVTPRGRAFDLSDSRIKAAIPMSSPAGRTDARMKQALAKQTVPCLHMTGTLDDSPITSTKAAQRRQPFDCSPAGGKYLLILKDADHMAFGDRRRSSPAGAPKHHDSIRMSSTAFLDAYLRGDRTARAWLDDGGFAAVLGEGGTWENK